MHSRLELQEKLSSLPNVVKAYYTPPESIKLQYPCIIYEKETKKIIHANDKAYAKLQPYGVTIIDRDPESTIPDALEDVFTYWSPGKPYYVDGLSHWHYTIYY